MHVLLCSATEAEIQPFFNKQDPFPGHEVEVLITGVGLVAATHAITKRIAVNPPDFVLQAGICGSLDNNLALADAVVVASDTVADAGVTEYNAFRTVFDMGLAQANLHPYRDGFLINPHRIVKECGLPAARGITVNEVSTNLERIKYYKENLQAEVESMEGAALHYACLQEKLPFLQLRTVSNRVGERNKQHWQLAAAIEKLYQAIVQVLPKIFIS